MHHLRGTLTEGKEYARPYKGSKAVKGGNVQGLDCLDRDVLDPRFGADICTCCLVKTLNKYTLHELLDR